MFKKGDIVKVVSRARCCHMCRQVPVGYICKIGNVEVSRIILDTMKEYGSITFFEYNDVVLASNIEKLMFSLHGPGVYDV